MDDGGPVDRIGEVDAEALAGRKRQPRLAARPDQSEYARRLAVDVEAACRGGEALGIGRGGA
jgi:hypothetical protein